MKNLFAVFFFTLFSISAFSKDGYELWLDYPRIESSALKTEVGTLFSGIYFFGQGPTQEVIRKELQIAGNKMLGKDPVFTQERLDRTRLWLGTR
ncbi:MAG: alpha-glucuronidase, partial [Cytophagales bacterium]